MKYTPKNVKRVLNKTILELSSNLKSYTVNPEKDFSRNRKLPFDKLITSMLSMSCKTLRSEILEKYGFKEDFPTVSAFVQQRNKLHSSFFEDLFKNFTNATIEHKTFNGYRLLAIDGSDLHVPTNRNETDSFYQKSNGDKPYNKLHLNATFDLLSKTYSDAVVNKSEHKAFVSMVDRNPVDIPTIYIADRGYEAYNNFAHVQENGQFFLIRVKDVSSKNGITKGLCLPCDDEFDVQFSLNITRAQTKSSTLPNLKYIAHSSPFDFLPPFSKKATNMTPFPLHIRVVRFKITDDTYETIITNLPVCNFSSVQIKQLYALRWGIETSFRSLKYTLGLIYFHSKKTEHIISEIFAKLTMYNFAQIIASNIIIKQMTRKLTYQINFSAAVLACRNFFLNNISPSLLETFIANNLLPIRVATSSSRERRNTNPRSAASFSYRIA